MNHNDLLRANPVASAELRHQRFVIQRSRAGYLWIALAALMMIPALLYALFYSGVTLAAAIAPHERLTSLLQDLQRIEIGIATLLVMNVALYVVVTLITLGLAANSIQRERSGNTWDSLRLTNIGASRIVLGKWAASLRALWGDHLMLAILRLGLAAFLATYAAPFFAAFNGETGARFIAFYPMLLLFTLLYTAADAMLSAALGLLAALPQGAAGSSLGTLAAGLRFATMGGAGIFVAFCVVEWVNAGDATLLGLLIAGLLAWLAATAGALFAARALVR